MGELGGEERNLTMVERQELAAAVAESLFRSSLSMPWTALYRAAYR